MTHEEAEKKYLEYLEGHIGNVKEAFELLCTLDIPFINDNKTKLEAIVSEHDASKYEEPEWTAYLHHFYPTCDEDSLKTEEFEEACRHHIHTNPHHWDYWVDDGKLIEDIDEEEYKLYTVERMCDHMAMSIQNDNKPSDWYYANKENIIMPDYGYELYEEILEKLPDDYDLSFHGTRTEDKPERDTVNEDLYMNKEVVDSLGKRVKKSKTSNTIEIDTQMTNHDEQLKEHIEKEYNISVVERGEYEGTQYYTLSAINKETEQVEGFIEFVIVNNEIHIQNTRVYEQFRNKRVGSLLVLKLQELAGDDYIYLDLVVDESEGFWNKVANLEVYKKGGHGIPYYRCKVKDNINKLVESALVEMKLSQIKQKSKSEDPERVNRSRKVKTTYLGMSKFGILNFKTTSQSRNGHHYQTIEFKDMKPFEDIVKQGKEIMPDDVKKQLQNQDVNVFCTDESFSYWAWAHSAYKNDFLYIDDRIPDLKKRIQAPKVNNVRLNGGSCKHILSVIDYCTRPFVLLAISQDMNKFLAGTQEDKMNKQSVATQNQYDAVADWDWSDIEEYTGLSRIQIMSDISKTLQIIPNVDKGDIITDIVGEALPNDEQGLKRDIVDKIEDLIDSEK